MGGIIPDCANLHNFDCQAVPAETFWCLQRASMNHLPSSERELLERARQHDEKAFSILVEQYTAAVFRIVRRMVQDRMEAESIVQETFWRFWQALPRYTLDRPILPYLATIASNVARDQYRRDRRLEDISVEDVLEGWPDESDSDPERIMDDERARERLAASIPTLPFAYRAVISLRYEAGMSYEEIALALALPVNTVRTHLRRAKQALRRKLEEADDG